MGLDPGNGDAARGLEDIEERYKRLAEDALSRGQKNKVRRYIESIRKVNPESLVADGLEERILERKQKTVLATHSTNNRSWRDPTTGMEFVKIPDGCFKMGSGEGNEKPPHEVCGWVLVGKV